MKKLFTGVLTVLLILGLGGCSLGKDPNQIRTFVLGEIDFFVQNNDYINESYKVGLDDVDESSIYVPSDFFNYDLKDYKNVEIEYDDYYSSFSNLVFVKQAIELIENFEYGKYYNGTISNETVAVEYKNEVLKIEYFEYLTELSVITRHSYTLSRNENNPYMEKLIEIYDVNREEFLIAKKLTVKGDSDIENFEYYPTTGSFVYEYTSYNHQEYFKYSGTMLDDFAFIRQTVEYYIPNFKAYVSYDIKDDLLEDYRVKLFDDGHRVLKVDVNISKNNPQINELTWNLLSIDGWDRVESFNDNYYIFNGNTQTMNDYDIDVQLNGYGKVTAYKLYEGEFTEESLQFGTYPLVSPYSMNNITMPLTYFEDNYESVLNHYGFNLNDTSNRLVVYDEVHDESSEFLEYIEDYK